MTNSDSTALEDPHSEPASPSTQSRAQALNRLREVENERLGEEYIIRKRLMWLGIVVGAAVGMTVGYMGTLITIVDAGVGNFGFDFYRPNFIDGFLRVITAYIIAGGFVGGGLSYVLFTTRSEAASLIRWLIVGVSYALATPLLIGFLLPVTFLLFADIVNGLRPGLWLSAFVETLLGSFLDGYIFMVKILAAGWIGTVLFLVLMAATYTFSQRVPLPENLTRNIPSPAIYSAIAAVIAILPLLILAFGPFSLTTSFTSFITGENL